MSSIVQRGAVQPVEAGAGGLGRRVISGAVMVAANLAAFFVIFQLYKMVRRTFVQRGEAVGFDHAHQIIHLQQRLGIFIEPDLQGWALRHEWVIRALNWYYAGFQWTLYLCCALAIALAPVQFRRVRRVFLLTFVLALPWYALYPLTPPRFMTEYGLVDTLKIYGPNYFSNDGMVGANQFAAMPSMHIGWSTIAAMMLAVAIPYRRIGLALGALHVGLMTLTVMATGNHYLLDAVGGWMIVLAAIWLAGRLPAELPLPWARRQQAADAEARPAPGMRPAYAPVSVRSGSGARARR